MAERLGPELVRRTTWAAVSTSTARARSPRVASSGLGLAEPGVAIAADPPRRRRSRRPAATPRGPTVPLPGSARRHRAPGGRAAPPADAARRRPGSHSERPRRDGPDPTAACSPLESRERGRPGPVGFDPEPEAGERDDRDHLRASRARQGVEPVEHRAVTRRPDRRCSGRLHARATAGRAVAWPTPRSAAARWRPRPPASSHARRGAAQRARAPTAPRGHRSAGRAAARAPVAFVPSSGEEQRLGPVEQAQPDPASAAHQLAGRHRLPPRRLRRPRRVDRAGSGVGEAAYPCTTASASPSSRADGDHLLELVDPGLGISLVMARQCQASRRARPPARGHRSARRLDRCCRDHGRFLVTPSGHKAMA